MTETATIRPMQIDGFLKVPDIPGDSRRERHEDEMEVFAIAFEMEAPHDPNTSARRGRVSLSPVRFRKHYDRASPHLKRACFQNRLFPEVVFTARRTVEGETSDYLTITLGNASIVSYRLGPSPLEPALIGEEIAVAYERFAVTYDHNHAIEIDLRTGR
jgi:type VI secretion system secreted protein Hcp